MKHTGSIDEILNNPNIAGGGPSGGGLDPSKEEINMTMYEIETMVPGEYKKLMKKVDSGTDWTDIPWPKGKTLLHWAAGKGHEDVCKFLVFKFFIFFIHYHMIFLRIKY